MLPGGMQIAASCAAVPKQQGRRLHLPCCGRSDGPFFWRGEGIAGDADGSPPHETDDVPHETRAVRAAGDESRGVCRNRRGAGEPHLKICRIDFARQQHSVPCRRPHVPEPSPPVSQGAGGGRTKGESVSGNGRPGGGSCRSKPPAGRGRDGKRPQSAAKPAIVARHHDTESSGIRCGPSPFCRLRTFPNPSPPQPSAR